MKKVSNINTILIITVCFLLFAVSIYIQKVFAETDNNGKIYVSIIISNTCIKSPSCPTYKELADLFDNSDKKISGDFKWNNDTDTWRREKPLYKNDLQLYKYGKNSVVTFVDPNDMTRQSSKLIFIESSMSSHIDRGNNVDRVLQKQYSEKQKEQNILESDKLNKKYTLLQEESLLAGYKTKMQNTKNNMELKKSYYESLIITNAQTTEKIALEKNAQKSYNDAVTENSNAISQYQTQQIKIDKIKSELVTMTNKFRENNNYIKTSLSKASTTALSMPNNTISYNANRIITGCTEATIGWVPYGAKLLAETLDYFRHDCKTDISNSTLNKVTKVEIYQKPTIFTDCGKACEYTKWLKQAKIDSKSLQLGNKKTSLINGSK